MISRQDPIEKRLSWYWFLFAFVGYGLILFAFLWLRSWWTPPHPRRWFLVAALTYGAILWILGRNLDKNHRPGEEALFPTLGLGNTISLLRGVLMAALSGFLFLTRPLGKAAWLPGILYTAAALPDFLDGAVARLRDHVTELGAKLDVSIDSLGVLAVTAVAVQYEQVPAWYLLVGLARYLFLAGIWIRERLGKPVYELRYSIRRRGFAGLSMGFFFVVLYPIFGPPSTYLAATVFGIYILGGFLWDWLLVSGVLSHNNRQRFDGLKAFALRWLPLGLRAALIPLVWLHLAPQSWTLTPLLLVEIIVSLAVLVGLAGRVNAIVALISLGLQQAATSLDWAGMTLIIVYANLLFLGTGAFSLWPVEDNLIYKRVGD